MSTLLTQKLLGFGHRLRYLPRTFSLVAEATGTRFGWWLALLAAQGLLPIATVYLSRTLVNRLTEVIGPSVVVADPYAATSLLVMPVLGLVAVLIGGELLKAIADYFRTVQAEMLEDHISQLVHAKSTSVDLAFYEWPEFYDHLHRAQSEATYRPVMLIESLGSLLQNGLTLLAMAAVLLPYGWWLPVALLASSAPAFWAVLRYSVEQHQWQQRTTADDRKSRYYSWLMTTAEVAAELRLFQLGEHFQRLYGTIRSRLRQDARSLARRHAWTKLLAGASAMLITAATLGWMVLRAIRNQSTLGDLALFYQAFSNGQRMMQASLQQVGQLYYHSLFLGNLFEYLELRPTVVSPPVPKVLERPLREGYRIEGVTFGYPESPSPALENFSLNLPAGKFAALVGPNGAGKSTIVKLLCRLYDPQQGRILLGGCDLRELAVDQLRSRITILFQQPVHFNTTVHENIAWGDLANDPTREQVATAAEQAGAAEVIGLLPEQYDQLLGKWHQSGAELSVGQWQRIALGRAFLRQADVIILDEPTSAMDPWAEADWLQRFRKLAENRTVLLITHRFTSAMYADTIHVMAQGRIVETGTHQELIDLKGLYSRSWRSQTRS